MNPVTDDINTEVTVTPLPDLPTQGHTLCRLAIGHLPHQTGNRLIRRLVERSAYGAKKFGESWRGRENTKELCEETTDAIVYASQETANIDLGLTPLAPGSPEAAKAKEFLMTSARYGALADHHAHTDNQRDDGIDSYNQKQLT